MAALPAGWIITPSSAPERKHPEPGRAIAAQNPELGTRAETVRRRYEVAQLMKLGLSVRTIATSTGIPPTSVHRVMRAIAKAGSKQEVAVLQVMDRMLNVMVRKKAKRQSVTGCPWPAGRA
jgi:DNA-binding NarL/FixJ family response regulator